MGIDNNFEIFEYSISNRADLEVALQRARPQKVFFPIGESSTRSSFEIMTKIIEHNMIAVSEQIEALKNTGFQGEAVFFGSSEIFGYADKPGEAADENKSHSPANVYGLSKSLSANFLNYIIENAGMAFSIMNAFLFPHESEYKGSEFVVRKIVRTLTQHALGKSKNETAIFGDLQSTRDWGSAKTFMKTLVSLTESSASSGNYVLGTGNHKSVQELFESVARLLDISIEFSSIQNKVGIIDSTNGRLIAKAQERKLSNQGHGYVANTSKIQSVVSLEHSPFDEVLIDMIRAESSRSSS
jgi:GDP-D-mannose dehydratase